MVTSKLFASDIFRQAPQSLQQERDKKEREGEGAEGQADEWDGKANFKDRWVMKKDEESYTLTCSHITLTHNAGSHAHIDILSACTCTAMCLIFISWEISMPRFSREKSWFEYNEARTFKRKPPTPKTEKGMRCNNTLLSALFQTGRNHNVPFKSYYLLKMDTPQYYCCKKEESESEEEEPDFAVTSRLPPVHSNHNIVAATAAASSIPNGPALFSTPPLARKLTRSQTFCPSCTHYELPFYLQPPQPPQLQHQPDGLRNGGDRISYRSVQQQELDLPVPVNISNYRKPNLARSVTMRDMFTRSCSISTDV
ncbi:uncharacterized protein V6R79_012468 [Siganus canaliculatus]